MRFLTEDISGQSSVEAAFAIPILMLLMLLLLEPGIVLYDWIVMNGAAAEGCRLLSTSDTGQADTNEDYIRRRLSAIPEVDIFHEHTKGCSYDIEFTGDESASEVSVCIENKIKPLPLLDMGMSVAGLLDENGDIGLTAQKTMTTQPQWVQKSALGKTPSEWVGSWE